MATQTNKNNKNAPKPQPQQTSTGKPWFERIAEEREKREKAKKDGK